MVARPDLPKTPRGERSRAKILRAAQWEIGRKGFHTASVSSITRRAGVSQGSFYLYFESKESVFRDLVLEMGRRLRAHLTEATRDLRNRREAERAGLRAFLEYVRKNPDFFRIVEEAQFVDPKVYRQYFTDFADAYKAQLEAGGGGQMRGDVEIRAWILMGISKTLGQRYGLWDTETSLDDVVAVAMEFIDGGLPDIAGHAKAKRSGQL